MQISNPTKKQAGICYAQHTPSLHEKSFFYELDNDGFTIGSRDFGYGIFTLRQNTTELWLTLEYIIIFQFGNWTHLCFVLVCTKILTQIFTIISQLI